MKNFNMAVSNFEKFLAAKTERGTAVAKVSAYNNQVTGMSYIYFTKAYYGAEILPIVERTYSLLLETIMEGKVAEGLGTIEDGDSPVANIREKLFSDLFNIKGAKAKIRIYPYIEEVRNAVEVCFRLPAINVSFYVPLDSEMANQLRKEHILL